MSYVCLRHLLFKSLCSISPSITSTSKQKHGCTHVEILMGFVVMQCGPCATLIGWMKSDCRMDNPKSADDDVGSITPAAGGASPLCEALTFSYRVLKDASQHANTVSVKVRVSASSIMSGIRTEQHSSHASPPVKGVIVWCRSAEFIFF